MKYLQVKLPGDILKISKIIIGTDYFGTKVSEKESFIMFDAFLDLGGNCIDTARAYTAWLPGGEGISEKLIGRWLKKSGKREKIVISTKGGYPPIGHMHEGRLSRDCIESDLEESLKTLGIDYIDLYWLHRDDIARPVEEIMETVAKLVSSGRIRSIGCSNWKSERIKDANAYAQAHGIMPFCSSQIQWSLASSTPEAHKDDTMVCMDPAEYKWYTENNMSVLAYSAQAQGFFTRAASGGLDSINKNAAERFLSAENIARLERVKSYAARSNLSISAVVLGYIICNRLPAAAIVGCKTKEQLMDTLTASDVSIPAEDTDWLDRG